MAQMKHESDGIKMSVSDEIRAWALLNIRDIMQFVMCAHDDEIVERYGDEKTAIEICEKYVSIAMKAAMIEVPLAGWSMKYSQPVTGGDGKRVTHDAYFYTVTEGNEDADN